MTTALTPAVEGKPCPKIDRTIPKDPDAWNARYRRQMHEHGYSYGLIRRYRGFEFEFDMSGDRTFHATPAVETAVARLHLGGFQADLFNVSAGDDAFDCPIQGWHRSPLFKREADALDYQDALVPAMFGDPVPALALGAKWNARMLAALPHVGPVEHIEGIGYPVIRPERERFTCPICARTHRVDPIRTAEGRPPIVPEGRTFSRTTCQRKGAYRPFVVLDHGYASTKPWEVKVLDVDASAAFASNAVRTAAADMFLTGFQAGAFARRPTWHDYDVIGLPTGGGGVPWRWRFEFGVKSEADALEMKAAMLAACAGDPAPAHALAVKWNDRARTPHGARLERVGGFEYLAADSSHGSYRCPVCTGKHRLSGFRPAPEFDSLLPEGKAFTLTNCRDADPTIVVVERGHY